MNFKKNKLKDVNNTSKLFYIISFASLVVCIIMGVLSNGVTVSNLLFNKDDVFMDFFNSVVDCSGDAYGESGVIYPPLVVLFQHRLNESIRSQRNITWNDNICMFHHCELHFICQTYLQV